MRRSICSLGIAAALMASLFASRAWAQFPVTELTTISPAGAKQGATLEVVVGGGNQERLSSLDFSHAGITAKQKTVSNELLGKEQPVNNTFVVSVAANVPPGIYEARVTGLFGTSNTRRFVVGKQDELVDDGSNKSVSTPRELPVNTVVNGLVDANTVDYYQVHLAANQRVLIDCQAQRIDSKLDGTLVLLDPQQREVARSADSIGRDPQIDFTASAEGDYVVCVYDLIYGGGVSHFYRLAVHDQPHVDYVFPPSGKPGSNEQYTIYGRNLPNGKPVEGITMNGIPLQQVTTNIQLPAEISSANAGTQAYLSTASAVVDTFEHRHAEANPVQIGFATDPIVREAEANDTPDKSQTITVPCEVVGQFYPERDIDWVQFEAKQGDVYWIEVLSHRMGLESDPVMLVQQITKNDQGEEQVKEIAAIDDPGDRNARIAQDFDTSTDDPAYRFAVPADGLYRVMVRDQFGDGRADPRFVYRLRIRREQPSFQLVAHLQQTKVANNNQVPVYAPVVRRGGSTLVRVEVIRQDGFDGAVDLSIEGLPAGVTCKGASLSNAVNTAWLVIEAAENAQRWQGELQIVGRAKVAEAEIVRRARYTNVVWGTANRTTDPALFRLSPTARLSVIDKHVAVGFVQAGDGNVVETSRGGKVELPIKVTRREGFKEALSLVSTGLPGEIKPGNVAIAADKAEGTFSVVLNNNNTKPGNYTFYLRADTKQKLVRDPLAIPEAEEEAKVIATAATQTAEELKQATAARDQANKEMQTAANELKQSQQAKTTADNAVKASEQAAKQASEQLAAAQKAVDGDAENADLKTKRDAAKKKSDEANAKLADAKTKQDAAAKAVADMETKNTQATEKKTAMEQKFQEVTAKNKRTQDAKTAADKKVADTKKAQAAKDVNIVLASTPIRLVVHQSPIKLAADNAAVKQGEKAEVSVKLERLFGFADPVDITFEAPKGVGGLSAAKLQIAKDQAEGKLQLTAAKNAPAGDHAVTIRAKAKFNNVNIEATQNLQLKVEAVDA